MIRGQRGVISCGIVAAALLVAVAMLRFSFNSGSGDDAGTTNALRISRNAAAADTRRPQDSRAGEWPASAQRQHASLSSPQPPSAPRGKHVVVVIRFANRFGRHSNQLKGHLHAVALAKIVARRLSCSGDVDEGAFTTVHAVLEPFSSSGSVAAFSSLYNMSALEDNANNNNSDYVGGGTHSSSSSSNDARCAAPAVPRRIHLHDGVDDVLAWIEGSLVDPLQPSGENDEEHIAFPRKGIPSKLPFRRRRLLHGLNRTSLVDAPPMTTTTIELTTRDFERVATTAADAVAASLSKAPTGRAVVVVRQLFFYELVYYDGVVDQSASVRGGAPGIADSLWAGLQPSADIQRSIAEAVAVAVPPAPMYDAVHIRTLEGSCIDRLATLIRKRKLPFPMAANDGAAAGMSTDALHWQCRLGQRFANIRQRLRNDTSGMTADSEASPAPVFLAVDDDAVKRRLVDEAAGRAFGVPSPSPSRNKRSHAMLVDFWLCARAPGRFVGNAASTLSRNVCYVRRAQGRIATDDPVDCRFVIRP